jgi:ubiquinone/menaquinone biosynthesis C-methylase UbiE
LQEAGFIDIRCAMHFHYAIDSRVAIRNYVPGARGERVHAVIQARQAQAMHLRRRGLIRFEGDRSHMLAPGEMTMAQKPTQAAITHATFAQYPSDLVCSLACYRELQQRIVDHMPTGVRLLDVACGPGHLMRFLADRYTSYTGLDISAAFIQTARERYGWQSAVRFDVADMNDMVVDRHQYDVIVVANALYLPEVAPAKVLQQTYEALVPGGRLMVSGPASAESFQRALPHIREQLAQDGQLDGNEAQWQAIVDANARLLSDHCHYWSANEMADLLRRLGFGTIITADPTPYYGTGYLVVAEK